MKFKYGLVLLSLIGNVPVCAEVPVVDDSANYAIAEQEEAFIADKPVQQIAQEQQWQEPLSQNKEPQVYEQRQKESQGKHFSNGDENFDTQDNAGLLARLNALQQEVQQLRGQLEVQQHDLKLLQQQQLAFYKDLDARVTSKQKNSPTANNQVAISLETASAKEVSLNRTENTVQAKSNNQLKPKHANPADEQLSYVAAYELVKSRKFQQATDAMQAFLKNYPESQFAANAHYWLGELFLLKRQFLFASREFTTVLKQFPRSTKIAAAQLKLGYAYADMGNVDQAKNELNQVIQQFPDTSAAQLAKRKLIQLSGSV